MKSPFTKTLNSMYTPNSYEREQNDEINKYFVKEEIIYITRKEQYNNIEITFPSEGPCYFKAVIYSIDSSNEEVKLADNLVEVT